MEGERHAALELAAASKAEVAQLQEAQRRLQWQSQLLEKMSEVRRACLEQLWAVDTFTLLDVESAALEPSAMRQSAAAAPEAVSHGP
jgi:hypothetical protein